MIVEVENRKVNIPDSELEKLKTKLNISTADAIECWLEDNDEIELDEESQALQDKASKVKVDHDVSYKKTDKQRKPRTYNASDTKKQIFADIWEQISAIYGESATIKTQDKMISLIVDGKNFDINLVEHRPPKK